MSTAAAALLAMAVVSAPAALARTATRTSHAREPARMDTITEGTWTATGPSDGGARLRLELHWGTATWGRWIARSELRGVPDQALTSAASTPVTFRIERESGVFEMEGAFRESSGSGRFRFQPNRGFAATLGAMGVAGAERITDSELMVLAVNDASSATVRELATLLGPLDADDVIRLASLQVTPEYVRSLRSAGVPGSGTAAGVAELRTHRITAEYVHELAAAGYGHVSQQDLLELGMQGIGAETIREFRGAGYTTLSPRQLVEMRIHRITPAYIRDMRQAGLGDLSPEELIRLRDSRVTLDYVRELEALGYRGLTQQQLSQMAVAGITPAFIRETREAGFPHLSPEELMRLKNKGRVAGRAPRG